ncbi:MAG: group I intron-associated PD-(D/E)XK endonuclease [Candidatus Sulfotelmatobacter sp.]
MAKCKGFRNFKQRGEWVELLFMAWALRKGLRVSKPWGDSSPYDVGVEHGQQLIRVQVKSTSYRLANGYLCGFKPNQKGKQYTTRKVDFFAAYIVPEEIWYVIPAAVVLKTKSLSLMLCPVQPMQRDCYKYEGYRDAWKLLRLGYRRQVPSKKVP